MRRDKGPDRPGMRGVDVGADSVGCTRTRSLADPQQPHPARPPSRAAKRRGPRPSVGLGSRGHGAPGQLGRCLFGCWAVRSVWALVVRWAEEPFILFLAQLPRPSLDSRDHFISTGWAVWSGLVFPFRFRFPFSVFLLAHMEWITCTVQKQRRIVCHDECTSSLCIALIREEDAKTQIAWRRSCTRTMSTVVVFYQGVWLVDKTTIVRLILDDWIVFCERE